MTELSEGKTTIGLVDMNRAPRLQAEATTEDIPWISKMNILLLGDATFRISHRKLSRAEGISADYFDVNQMSDFEVFEKVLNEDYDAIILPLTLRGLLSLNLAQLIHRLEIESLLILVSDTRCPKKILLELFDLHFGRLEYLDTLRMKNIENYLGFPGRVRSKSPDKVESAAKDIFDHSNCFSEHGSRLEFGNIPKNSWPSIT